MRRVLPVGLFGYCLTSINCMIRIELLNCIASVLFSFFFFRYTYMYSMKIIVGPLTVITPSLIAFLFRITIPMGFRMNFFGMAVVQNPSVTNFFVVLQPYVVVSVCLLYLFNVNQENERIIATQTQTYTRIHARAHTLTKFNTKKCMCKLFAIIFFRFFFSLSLLKIEFSFLCYEF